MTKLFGPGAVADEPPAGDPPPPNPPPSAPSNPPPPEPPAPEEPAPEVGTPAATTLSIADIRNATREGVAEGMRAATAPTPPAPEKPTLQQEDEEDLAALRWLEKNNKVKAGTADAYLAFLVKFYAYVDDWLQKNPDGQFDAEANEHATWIAQNQPEIPERAVLDKAIRKLEIEAEVEERVKPKLQEIDQRQAEIADKELWESGPVRTAVKSQVDTKIVQMVDMVSPDLGKLLRDAGGALTVTDEAGKKIEAADPIAHEVLYTEVATNLAPIVNTLEYMTHVGGILNPQNPVHREIMSMTTFYEDAMAKAPADKRTENGREWVTTRAWNQKYDEIFGSRATDTEKQQQWADYTSKHWFLSPRHLEELAVDEAVARAKKEITRRDTVAKKKYGQNTPPAPVAQPPPVQQPTPPNPTPPATAGNKPRSPSISSSADVLSTGNPTTVIPKTEAEAITAHLFRR